ncbi:MAG: NADH-quinone oxidoreductase subunit NuoK [Gemmatales bacterium]|nr:NADH-quinone oxidoreductase subunit NuoK [Gemmatales bacterium]MDW8176254.1 NADH-quinone oxidoreductase subunit NuoK [Gemmatales bacterium]
MQLSGTNLIAVLIFATGAVGFLVRRNVILMVLFAELMLQAVSLNLASAGFLHGDYGGQVLAILVITVAACEAALALVFALALYQRKSTLDISQWSQLGEEVIREKEKEIPYAAGAASGETPQITRAL